MLNTCQEQPRCLNVAVGIGNRVAIRNVLVLAALLAGLGVALTGLSGKATAQGFTTLYSFTSGNDGSLPQAALVLSGNTLFGTALEGGSAVGPSGNGTVFAINANGSGFTVLHTFTGSDGDGPFAGLILSGNTLYGTASQGGSSGQGTVFAINTNGSGFTNLYSFSGGNDGATPRGGLILSGNTLYGTAAYGGTSNWGTVFAVNTNGSGFSVLHTFTGGSDGASPLAGLVLTGGTLYGTAEDGGSSGYGSSGYGTVFAIKTNGSGFTVLHSFTGGSDGAFPKAGLVSSGNTLYSTAAGGGNGGPAGDGTVFAINTNGTGFAVLHTFGGSEGAVPFAGLVLSSNTLYGAVEGGGSQGYGTVFAVTTDGTAFTVLHNFDHTNDGEAPVATLLLSGGNLYGTAEYGGNSNAGTVFVISSVISTWTWNGSVSSDWFNPTNWTPLGPPLPSGTINFTNGAINLSSPVTLSGQFNWTGGSLSGSALTIASNGVMNITAGGYLGNALTNAGTINWLGGDVHLDACSFDGAAGPVVNLAGGVWNIQCDQSLNYNCSANGNGFVNAGMVRKLAGSGTTFFSVPFYNSGTVQAQSGIISLQSGGNLGGQFVAASGAAIHFDGGLFPFVSGGPASSGAGQVQFGAGATVTFSGPITNLNLNAGTLAGSNVLTGTLNWSGGTLSGPLTITSNGVLSITAGGGSVAVGNALTNAGTVNWLGGDVHLDACNFDGAAGPVVNLAGGVWNIQCDQSLSYNCSANGNGFVNAGMVRKLAGSGITSFYVPFNNTGTVQAQSGTISLQAGGNLGGQFVAASGAAIHFDGGLFPFVSGGPASSGAGQVQFGAGATVTFSGPITNLNLNAGTLAGSNVLTGTLNWSGGTLSGPLTITSNGVLSITAGGGYVSVGNALTNGGTVNWLGGDVHLDTCDFGGAAGPVVNLAGGVWNIQCDQRLDYYCAANGNGFVNAGTVRKLAGSGITSFYVPFNNTGTVQAQSGIISLQGGGNLGGQFVAASGAAIHFDGGLFPFVSGGPASSGAGQVQFNPGATVTFSGPITNLNLNTGTLAGSNVLTGTLNCSGGTLSGPLTIASTGVMNINAGGYLDNALTNAGTVNWLGGDVHLDTCGFNGTAGPVVNLASGVWNIQCDQRLDYNCSGNGNGFVNAGTVQKLASTGTTMISVPLTNLGTMVVETGTLQPAAAFTQAGGTLAIGINAVNNSGRFNFSNPLAVAGALQAHINGGYIPSTNDTFTLLTYPSSTGSFSSFTPPSRGLWRLDIGSTAASITATGVVTAPIIIGQPQGLTVAATYSATFSVAAVAVPSPAYQWLQNGAPIAGATGATFNIPYIQPTNAGGYSVLLTNTFGSVTSSVAMLTVLGPYTFSTFAGSNGISGTNDGLGNAALFYNPSGIALDSAGNLYVADTSNDTIRKVAPDGTVTTVAGSPRQIGSADGTGGAARFFGPWGIAVDSATNLYVADADNMTIRKITSAGVVSTFAGSPGQLGSSDGTGSFARFNFPAGIAVDSAGNVYVADRANNTIRKITPGGTVTTLAGSAGQPGSGDGTGSAARFSNPTGLAVNSAGNLFVADSGNATIRKVSPNGTVTTVAGTPGQTGSADGIGSAARFTNPDGVSVDSVGNLYVSDDFNQFVNATNLTIRKVAPDGTVTTVAGSPGKAGSADGIGSAVRFNFSGAWDLVGITVDGLGNLYVADGNQTIRRGLPAYNDLFVWRTPLTGQAITATATNTTATKEPGEPNHNGNAGGKSLWWTWGAFTNGPVTIDTIGSTFDTVLAVYTANSPTNPSVSNLTLVTSDGNSGGNHASLLTFQPVPGTVYQIAVDGYNGATGTVALHLNQTSGAAQFVSQPQGLTVLAGSNVTFSASASGSLPLSFQWFKDGVALGGQSNGTTTTYEVTNAQASASGAYTVALSNSFGSITSAPALLTVLPRPSNDDYVSAIALFGASVSASGTNTQATPDGFEPFAFGGHSVWWTWMASTNGTVTIDTIGSSFDTILGVFTNASPNPVLVASDDQSGGNNASLLTFDVLPNQTFLIAVDGSRFAAPGQGTGTIVLNIHLISNPPQITLQPQSQNVLTGSNVTFTVTANGTAPLSYQWQKNGTNIAGATTTTFTLTNVQLSDSGTYSVHVTNPVGATNSGNAALNVVTPPPNDLFANAIVIPNSSLTNTVFGENIGASGEPGEPNPAGNAVLESVWWKWTAPTNGTVILDTTGTTFADVLAAYTGSSVSSLTLIGSGVSAGLSPAKVVFTATAGVTYYFAVDGQNPPGSGPPAPPVAGNITLNVQESIRIAPQIITQPVSQTILAGGNVTFTVVASGVPTPTYQWQFNGAPLSGKTGTSLSLSNVSTNQAGAYAVLISNIVGTVFSAQAVLRVDSAVKMSFRANWPDFETGGAEDVQIADGFAYLATDAGLIIVDVSTDPTAPRQVGTYNTDSPGIRVAVTNGFAYLLTASNQLSGAVLSRFDVHNPALPRKVAAYLGSAANDFALAGSSICLVDGQKLLVLNTNCGLLGSLTTANGVAQAVAAAQPYAYVAWPGFIGKYDISNPANPTPVQLDNQASGQLALSGQYLYSVSSSAGAVALQVLDVTDAVRPAVGNNVTNTLGDAQVQGLAVNDAGAYVVTAGNTANALAVYNRNLPPGLAGRILFSDGTPRRLFVDGTLAYVAAGGAGLKVFDVSDPANPVSTGQFLTAVQANQVVLQGNLAYVLDADPGFHVLDVSDPNNPVLLGSYESAHAPGGIAVQGRYVYLALNAPPTGIAVSGASMDIVDVASPNAPTRVGSTNLPPLTQGTNLLSTHVTALAVQGNLAVVASCLGTNASLAAVDVSNPARLQVTGRLDLPGTSQIAGLVLQGTYALVADTTFGLRVVDFSNPGKVAQVASFPEPPTTYSLMVQNGLCFLTGSYGTDVLTDNPPASPTRLGTMSRTGALTTLPAPFALESGSDGLTVWDLSNPTQWTALGQFAGVSGPVAVQGRYAFVAGGSNGFAALDLGSTFATPPTILAQPISLRVLPYSATNFFVAVSGTVPLTYQWSYNGANLSDGTHIGGSQSETLSLTNIQAGDVGQYSVVIGNALGSVTSAVATLSVDQLPSVSLTTPVDQEVFSPGVDIALGAQAFDPDGTNTQVAFYNGGTLLGVVASPPYGLTWRNVAAGVYHLSAVATDNEGATNVSSLVTIVVTNLPVIQLSQANYTVHESNGLATVTLFRNTNGPAKVDYFTLDGTARATGGSQVGSYYAVSNTLTFTPNMLSSNVTIQLVNSLVYRGNRSFQIQLTNPASGWTLASPSNATVTIIDDNPTSTTNSFTDVVLPAAPTLNPGSLTILLQPGQANGQWRFAWETAWRPSGSTVTNLVPGNYTLVFNDRSGWETPDSDVWVVSPGTAETNTYYYVSNGVAASGSLQVDILPPGLGAQWRPVANPTNSWLNSGAELNGILVGFIEVEFSDVSGYATPASRLVRITPGATEIQVTYFLAQAANGRTPQPLLNLAAITNPSAPYQFQGQLLTDVGYSSGFVVKDRTVLTAAHALFDPVLLSFTTNTVWWFFQREAGEYDPVPQVPRGWYVFQGYAASRTADITNAQNSGVGADDSSTATRQLDAAALYFFEAAGRGGYGGYLTTVPGGTDWLLSGPLMLLLGYPMETVPISDRGRLHQVGPGYCSLQNTPGTSLYFTSDFQSYPGNSGGPLCVWATNSSGAPFFLPAGIYLGGSGETIVRSIDLDVVDLITRADVSSHGGANNTGGGVITVSAGTVYGDTKSHLVVNLGPADALSKGGSFSLNFSGGYVENFTTAYSQFHFPDTLCPNCGNPSSITISFSAASGYDEPANTNVSLVVGQTKVVTAAYVPSPRLLVIPATGLSSSGYAGGSFTPASIAYTVSNIGSNALPWSASKTAPWLSLSQSGGTLAAGAGTGVTLSLNERANALSPGTYSDTIGFTNLTNGLGNAAFAVTLAVSVHPPVLFTNAQLFADGSFALTLQGVAGRVYSIVTSTNVTLPLTNWVELSNGSLALRLTNTAGFTRFTNAPSLSAPQLYYRAKELQLTP
jgi:uncharacterized repeat protein (TIGR03803 family)